MSEAPISSAVSVEKREDGIVVRLGAAILEDKDLKDAGRALDAASQGGGVTRVVLDLAAVQFVPSQALGALVQLAGRCRARQQTLKLAGLTPAVRQVFITTRLNRVLELAESVEAALRWR